MVKNHQSKKEQWEDIVLLLLIYCFVLFLLCCAVLCCAVLCCVLCGGTVLCAVLCCAVLWLWLCCAVAVAVWCVLCCAVLCCAAFHLFTSLHCGRELAVAGRAVVEHTAPADQQEVVLVITAREVVSVKEGSYRCKTKKYQLPIHTLFLVSIQSPTAEDEG